MQRPPDLPPQHLPSKAGARDAAKHSIAPNATAPCGNVLRQAAVCDSERPTNLSTHCFGMGCKPPGRTCLSAKRELVLRFPRQGSTPILLGLSSKRGLLRFGAKTSAVPCQNQCRAVPKPVPCRAKTSAVPCSACLLLRTLLAHQLPCFRVFDKAVEAPDCNVNQARPAIQKAFAHPIKLDESNQRG